MSDPKKDSVAEAAATLTAEDAVKLFSKQNITVNVPVTKKGVVQRDPDTKRIVTEDQPLAAGHIMAVSERGDEVVIATIDGKKYAQALK